MQQLKLLSLSTLLDYLRCNDRVASGEKYITYGMCYTSHDSLTVAVGICVYFIIYSFVWSILGQNCSKVDQIWSITPVVYCWHFFWHHTATKGVPHDRLLLVAVLATIWGVRLTYNFWKKGGYGNFFRHEEDYRWPILRAKMDPEVFLLFNFFFIACYQNVLLLWITAPVYELAQAPGDLTAKDLLLAALFLLLWAMETTADQQHWRFQALKHSLTPEQRAQHPDPDIRRGFFTQGLFRFCRHPNYFAEQAMWLVFSAFSWGVAPSAFSGMLARRWPSLRTYLPPPLNWATLGAVQLILLFQGSMAFGESISLSKYPLYKAYQQSTSKCLPWFPASQPVKEE